MPADAAVLSLVMGGTSARRVRTGQTEGSNATQDPGLAGHMAGQSIGRIDDTMLVREAQRGNRAAFEELVRHYDHAVLRLAMHLTGSE
ncbi:MAG: RNA polymerase sigma factor, partial [Acidobacteriales bacterium]|nr:RNA polymerase sigma factor [Terriglobales bacterium]